VDVWICSEEYAQIRELLGLKPVCLVIKVRLRWFGLS